MSTSARRSPRARGRARGVLGTEALVDVAMRIIDREGVEQVSMRRIAAEFDTGPASLYAHVANKDELLQLCVDRVLAELPLPQGETWQEVVRNWAFDSRNGLAAHGDIARLLLGVVPEHPHLTDVMEVVLGAMIRGGVTDSDAAWTMDVLSLYAAADAFEGWMMAQLFDDGSGRPPEVVGQEYFADFGARMAALPVERYPYLTAIVAAMTSGGGNERFAFGIDTFIAGIAARAEAGA